MTTTSTPSVQADRERALDLLRTRSRFLLVGHVRPDGDCVGAQAALARVLLRLGKEVVVLNPDDPGPALGFLTERLPFRVNGGQGVPPHDVCVLLDINELSRCGALEKPLAEASSKKVVIDHHPHDGEPWWDAAFVDVTASATGLLVWRIARTLEVEPDELIAAAVMTSLVTDTGWFKYSNTDGETMEIAAHAVRLGVDLNDLYGRLYQRKGKDEPLAVGEVLSRLEYFADGRLAVVDHPLRLGRGLQLQDSDPVLDIVRSVETVEVVLYLREIEAGLCKLSARSKTDFDVNRLARLFGGGGHAKASGATIKGNLGEVRSRLVDAATEMFQHDR